MRLLYDIMNFLEIGHKLYIGTTEDTSIDKIIKLCHKNIERYKEVVFDIYFHSTKNQSNFECNSWRVSINNKEQFLNNIKNYNILGKDKIMLPLKKYSNFSYFMLDGLIMLDYTANYKKLIRDFENLKIGK